MSPWRRLVTILFAAAAAGALSLSATGAAANVKASIVIDEATGQVLHGHNIDTPWSPASLTKMMTLYLVFQAIADGKLTYDQHVTVTRHAASRVPIKINLRAGQRIRIRTLVRAAAVRSANDAAAALADAIGGSETRFAAMMTAKARELGMTNTTFRNASGLPANGQITTARDMAILARAIRRDHPKYAAVLSRRHFRYGQRTYRNTNRLLHSDSAVNGMKTGYTRASRFNLVTSARRGDRSIITVVLGAPNSAIRYRTASTLMARAWDKSLDGPAVAKVEPRTSTTKPTATASKRIDLSVIRKAEAASPAADRPSPRPARTVARRPAGTAAPDTIYGIQVGAFRSRAAAQRGQANAARRIPAAHRRGTKPLIVSHRRGGRMMYMVRFVGMTADGAQNACAAAKQRRLDCIRVRYQHDRIAHLLPASTLRALAGRPAGPYAVQIGAGRAYNNLRRATLRAHRVLPSDLTNSTSVEILRPNTYRGSLYRGRIVGMTRDEAQQACRVLKGRGVPCLAIRHEV